MHKVWMIVIATSVLAAPSMAADKALMGAILGAGAGAAIGHATDRGGGSGKGAIIGALGGYVLGSQMDKGEQQAREAGRQEGQASSPPVVKGGAQVISADCHAADDYVSRAAGSRDSDDKIYFLEKAVKLCSNHAQAHNDLGVAYYSRNGRHDRDRARSEFNEALNINPNYTVARDNLRSL